ncbi:MAG: DegT/DnrJ/EryC1/StrS family aminotransferase [Thermoguttaceae bacterium]|nr:DegT/DnrJ/EryC1/StrS family aminotransferase [Thermoguttaceae bacterium]
MPTYEEYCEEIKSIWDSAWLTNMGPIHNRLKAGLRDYLKVENVELFVNGHLALYVALKALNLTGEIITTPFTFASTTNAIVQAGCVPVFCDVKDDYTIDETKIERLITEKTSAILGVHVYGNICAVDAIQKIADKRGIKAIYDAAHAFGVEYKGRGITSYGDVSMLSFHATKVFHSIEGGALCFNDSTLAAEIGRWRNFGLDGEGLACFGTNAKMNEFQAAMGVCNLRHIDGEIASRREAFARYDERLSGVAGLRTLPPTDAIKQNYAYYPILVDPERFGATRDELCAKLGEAGIFARKYFYPLVSENKAFGDVDLTASTPKALAFSRNVACLPLFAGLERQTVDRICDAILK